MTTAAVGAPGSPRRYLHSLWLLSSRDLRVRYATSALGYLWSVLDPLVMSAIYWFVFTQVFHRTVGHEPYIVFLLTALLPWVWFNSSVSDFTKAFSKDARLVRSTAIPRSIWANRVVLTKGIEFLCSLPVVIVFAIFTGAHVGWGLLWFPVAVILQTVLLVGLGLLVAPLCVLYTDLERTTRLILRALFYASPIIYGVSDLPGAVRDARGVQPALRDLHPLPRGVLPRDRGTRSSSSSARSCASSFLALGLWVFGRLERPVLKEL